VWIALVTAVYILLVASGPLGDPRMRAPAIAPLLLAAAAGLARRPHAQREIEPARPRTFAHSPLSALARLGRTSLFWWKAANAGARQGGTR